MTNGANSGTGTTDDPPTDILSSWKDKLPGTVLSAFVGAVTFVGIKSTEVSTLLRNNPVTSSLIALTLAAALAIALGSLFVQEQTDASVGVVIGVSLGALSVGALLIFVTPIPRTTSDVARWATLAIAVICLVGAIVVVARVRAPAVPVTLAIVASSVVLASGAAYGAMRLETASQLRATAPQMSASVDSSHSKSSLTVTVAATKLRPGERIGVTVRALRRDTNVEDACKQATAAVIAGTKPGTKPNTQLPRDLPCSEAPCLAPYLADSDCDLLSGSIFLPDADGAIDGKIALPFSSTDYREVGVVGQLCVRSRRQSKCKFDLSQGYARLDIALPE